jgi:uncharacterized membrane protein
MPELGHNHLSVKTSILKTATWYFCDLALTFLIAFLITRNLRHSIAIGLAQQTWELFLYFFHERAWAIFHKKSSGVDTQ